MASKPKAKAKPKAKPRRKISQVERQRRETAERQRFLVEHRELECPYNLTREMPPPPDGLLLVQTADGVMLLGKMIEGRFFTFPQNATELAAHECIRWTSIGKAWEDESVPFLPPEEAANDPPAESEDRP